MNSDANAGPMFRLRGDAGVVGGFEVLPFGFLLFVGVTLLFVNAWGVIDTKLAVSTAAQHAARSYSESDNESSARAAATDSANATLRAYGRSNTRASIRLRVSPRFARCARVTVTVSYQVPAIAIPFLNGFGNAQTVESSFTEVVDPFRNRLVGAAQC